MPRTMACGVLMIFKAGKGTQQEIHPHGKDEDKYDHAVLAAFPAAQDHGKRVREQQTDHSCDQGQKEREP